MGCFLSVRLSALNYLYVWCKALVLLHSTADFNLRPYPLISQNSMSLECTEFLRVLFLLLLGHRWI